MSINAFKYTVVDGDCPWTIREKFKEKIGISDWDEFYEKYKSANDDLKSSDGRIHLRPDNEITIPTSSWSKGDEFVFSENNDAPSSSPSLWANPFALLDAFTGFSYGSDNNDSASVKRESTRVERPEIPPIHNNQIPINASDFWLPNMGNVASQSVIGAGRVAIDTNYKVISPKFSNLTETQQKISQNHEKWLAEIFPSKAQKASAGGESIIYQAIKEKSSSGKVNSSIDYSLWAKGDSYSNLYAKGSAYDRMCTKMGQRVPKNLICATTVSHLRGFADGGLPGVKGKSSAAVSRMRKSLGDKNGRHSRDASSDNRVAELDAMRASVRGGSMSKDIASSQLQNLVEVGDVLSIKNGGKSHVVTVTMVPETGEKVIVGASHNKIEIYPLASLLNNPNSSTFNWMGAYDLHRGVEVNQIKTPGFLGPEDAGIAQQIGASYAIM